VKNFLTIVSVGAEFFYADRQTDRRVEANSQSLKFCEHAYNIRGLEL